MDNVFGLAGTQVLTAPSDRPQVAPKPESSVAKHAIDRQDYDALLAEGIAKGALPATVLMLGRFPPTSNDITLCSAIEIGRYDFGTEEPLQVFENPTMSKAYLVGRFNQSRTAADCKRCSATRS